MRHKKSNQLAGAFAAVFILVAVVVESGLLLPALGSGVVVSFIVWALFRKMEPALRTGGVAGGLIILIGIFNVVVPGWHNNLV